MRLAPRWRLYLRLGRVSNLPTVWTNVLAGIVLTGSRPAPATTAFLATALSFFYIGGMFLNDAFDRDVDARERPERPIPSGAVRAAEAFAIGYGLLAAGALLVALRAGLWSPATAAALALAAAIVLYNAWHKTNPVSPLLMGLCRVLVYVIAALAATGCLMPPVVGGALTLLGYLIGLTYVAKQENLARLRSLWPLAFILVPFLYGLPILLGSAPGALAYLALLTGVAWALALLGSGRAGRIPRAVAVMIAAISLLDAMLIAAHGPPRAVLVAALGFPTTLALQRYVSGT